MQPSVSFNKNCNTPAIVAGPPMWRPTWYPLRFCERKIRRVWTDIVKNRLSLAYVKALDDTEGKVDVVDKGWSISKIAVRNWHMSFRSIYWLSELYLQKRCQINLSSLHRHHCPHLWGLLVIYLAQFRLERFQGQEPSGRSQWTVLSSRNGPILPLSPSAHSWPLLPDTRHIPYQQGHLFILESAHHSHRLHSDRDFGAIFQFVEMVLSALTGCAEVNQPVEKGVLFIIPKTSATPSANG